MGILELERPSYREVIVRWQFKKCVDAIMIQLQAVEGAPLHWFFNVSPDILDKNRRGEYKIPFHLPAGHKFIIHVCGLSMQKLKGGLLGYKCVEMMEQQFRSELTIPELLELYRRACEHMKSKGKLNFSVCVYMTRNKREEYYTDIMHNHGGIMRKYIKDNNGDQASLINGQIEGLFFGTAVDKQTGLPPLMSHFGPRRLNVPTHFFINPLNNLYFADFYCNRTAHYVTLVLCTGNSGPDRFCNARLLEIDKLNNPFLKILPDSTVCVTQNIWVEVLVTEDVNIPLYMRNGAWWSTVTSTGTSRPGGIPKNPDCKLCNLYPT